MTNPHAAKGHYHLNPPPYSPATPKFYGVPDEVGAIVTDEQQQAYNVIRAFGAQGADQQTYVTSFFRGNPKNGIDPAPAVYQLTDIGAAFDLNSDQSAAINRGCANTRAEFITGMKIAPGLDGAGNPVAGVAACQSTTVSIANVGSQYAAICAAFQGNLNVAAR